MKSGYESGYETRRCGVIFGVSAGLPVRLRVIVRLAVDLSSVFIPVRLSKCHAR